MKVLVTGANGFIGRNVKELLNGTPGPDLLHQYGSGARGKGPIEIITTDKEGDVDVVCDLRDGLKWDPQQDIDVVIHLAAKSGVRSFEDADHENNVQCTANVIRWMTRYDVPMLVYSGSSSVYGNARTMDESAIPVPQSPYAQSKWACEKLIKSWVEQENRVGVTLRLFNAIGKYQRRDMLPALICEHLKMVAKGDTRGSIPVYGTRLRAWTHVNDIVNGFWSAINTFFYAKWGTYMLFNMGTSNSMTQRDLISAFEVRSGIDCAIRDLPPHDMDVQRTKADMGHFSATFGWAPNNRNIELGIEDLLKQYGLIT